MKVFFGTDLDRMVTELRGLAAPMLRCHVFPKWQDDCLILQCHVTAFFNNQIYEAVVGHRCEGAASAGESRQQSAVRKGEEFRSQVVERLKGFEVKYGLFMS